MIAHKRKLISAAVLVAALLATVAVARTVHTHAVGAQATTGSVTNGQAMNGGTIGAASGQRAPSALHGNFACPLVNYADCERLQMILPM